VHLGQFYQEAWCKEVPVCAYPVQSDRHTHALIVRANLLDDGVVDTLVLIGVLLVTKNRKIKRHAIFVRAQRRWRAAPCSGC
jgi:hypothetical protein